MGADVLKLTVVVSNTGIEGTDGRFKDPTLPSDGAENTGLVYAGEELLTDIAPVSKEGDDGDTGTTELIVKSFPKSGAVGAIGTATSLQVGMVEVANCVNSFAQA